jgi:hypothetical protein
MMSHFKRQVVWTAAVFAALSMSTAACAIDGRYRIEGHSPGSPDVYKGEAIIKKTGSTYSVLWRVGESGHMGTGILTSNVLSVFFQPLDGRAAPGVASFLIADDKVTEGTWTVLGGNAVGVERWTRDRGL